MAKKDDRRKNLSPTRMPVGCCHLGALRAIVGDPKVHAGDHGIAPEHLEDKTVPHVLVAFPKLVHLGLVRTCCIVFIPRKLHVEHGALVRLVGGVPGD